MTSRTAARSAAWTALAVLALTVVPLPVLGAVCGPADGCAMTLGTADHCRRTTVIVASDCCVEIEPATEAPRTTGALFARIAAADPSSWLDVDAASRHLDAVHPAMVPAARGTPLYTLFATLLN